MQTINELQSKGLSDKEISEKTGMTVKEIRARRSIALDRERAANATMAQRLFDKGYSKTAIGERMGVNESVVRNWLDPVIQDRANITEQTMQVLAKGVEDKTYIDVGKGVEQRLGISRNKLDTAVIGLKDEGYEVHYVKIPQLGTEKFTSIKVLVPPGTPYSETYENRFDIGLLDHYTEDSGRTWRGLEPIVSVDGSRVYVRFDEDGGGDRDGVVELRRGVDDISLGDANYSQVRIGVDGTHYMKGMAMYGDKIPPGYDMIYNTKKKKGTPLYGEDGVYKPMIDDPDNPFGTTLRQKHYLDANGKTKLSPVNLVQEEGDWNEWSRTLSSQILSKQTPALAKRQLELAFQAKRDEFDEIMSLTNPTIQKDLLLKFADSADSAALHLKAAALPRQRYQVLLPILSMKKNEVYAPNFDNGENVAIIRHPHGGIFEIPEVRVNNRNAEARSLIGGSRDAIGIHPDVAKRLSGAPNKNRLIRSSSPLQGLKDFDPVTSYPKHKGMKVMDNATKQLEMGKVSNLITDMTIKGANFNEIARAVRHSMVVIDAEKHKLNWKQSYEDNNISGLKKKYQEKASGGAATLISRAKSPLRVDYREEGKYIKDPKTGKTRKVYIDPKTGDKLYTTTGETYVNKRGETVTRETKVRRMAEVSDAHKLSSGTVIESIYADYANSLKSLARKARITSVNTKEIRANRSAKETFSAELTSLKRKLRDAYRKKPLERQAHLLANKIVRAKRDFNPDMKPKEVKRLQGQTLEEARARVQSKKNPITITDREWQAIQSGAVSPSFLREILSNTNTAPLKERALPRTARLMTSTKILRAQSMLTTGYDRAEVARALGVSVSTLDRALDE
jgi:DNA-binding NarL/FixJ family response regulator